MSAKSSAKAISAAKKGPKGKAKKPSKKQLEELARAEVAQKKLQQLRDLRIKYFIQTRLFLRDPLPVIVTCFDGAIGRSEDIDKILLTKLSLAASDLWAIYITFECYSYLTTLSLWMVKLDDKSMTVLCMFIEKSLAITHLHLIDNGLTTSQATMLAGLFVRTSKLSTLVLDYNPLGGSGAIALFHALARDLPPDIDTTTTISIKRTDETTSTKTTVTLPILPQSNLNHGLTRLSMKFCDIDASCGDALEDFIRLNKTVRELDLSGNALHAVTFYNLTVGLQFNHTLQNINLSSNMIMPHPIKVAYTAPNSQQHSNEQDTFTVNPLSNQKQTKFLIQYGSTANGLSASRKNLAVSGSTFNQLSSSEKPDLTEDEKMLGTRVYDSNFHISGDRGMNDRPRGLGGGGAEKNQQPADRFDVAYSRGYLNDKSGNSGDNLFGSQSVCPPDYIVVGDHLESAVRLLISVLSHTEDQMSSRMATTYSYPALTTIVPSSSSSSGAPSLHTLDLRQNAIGNTAANLILDLLKSRKTQCQSINTTSSAPMSSSILPVPTICIWLTERLRSTVFVKVLEINKWMDTLYKKRNAKKKTKKGSGKKKS